MMLYPWKNFLCPGFKLVFEFLCRHAAGQSMGIVRLLLGASERKANVWTAGMLLRPIFLNLLQTRFMVFQIEMFFSTHV